MLEHLHKSSVEMRDSKTRRCKQQVDKNTMIKMVRKQEEINILHRIKQEIRFEQKIKARAEKENRQKNRQRESVSVYIVADVKAMDPIRSSLFRGSSPRTLDTVDNEGHCNIVNQPNGTNKRAK